ncbi:MAG: hypothetical protein OSA97_06785 [Nevskia sp.]|nr:hypothetical protein [Nevskia sp.]
MSLINVAVERDEAIAIVRSDMRAFGFNVDSRPALAGEVRSGDTLEFFEVDEAGRRDEGVPALIRAVRAVMTREECPALRAGTMLLLLDTPGSSDPNYAEAAQRVQQQRADMGLDRQVSAALGMEQLMHAQMKALSLTPTRRERLAGFVLQALVDKYGKGDAELQGSHVAQQAVVWADALAAELDRVPA